MVEKREERVIDSETQMQTTNDTAKERERRGRQR